MTNPINKAQEVLKVLYDNKSPIPASLIARLSGLSNRDVNRMTSRLYTRNRISRIKIQGSFSTYYLNEFQLEKYESSVGRTYITTDHSNVGQKLKFLRYLRDNTIYSDYPVVSAIIADYERSVNEHANKD